MANISQIRVSGTTYSIKDENASSVLELTQAQYDALVTKDPDVLYVITDATAFDPSSKVDVSAITSSITSASTNSEVAGALATYNAINGLFSYNSATSALTITTL